MSPNALTLRRVTVMTARVDRALRRVTLFLFPGQQPLIIWWAILTHLTWGIGMLEHPSIAKTSVLVGLDRYADAGFPPRLIGAVLVTAASLAATGLILDGHHRLSRGWSMICVAPQYFLLLSALFTNTQIIAQASFHGAAVDRIVLVTLLGPLIYAASLHTVAIYGRYSRWTRYPRI